MPSQFAAAPGSEASNPRRACLAQEPHVAADEQSEWGPNPRLMSSCPEPMTVVNQGLLPDLNGPLGHDNDVEKSTIHDVLNERLSWVENGGSSMLVVSLMPLRYSRCGYST